MSPQPSLAHKGGDLDEPIPVVVDICRLLRSMTPPADRSALIPWLTGKADLFDRIAAATANPGLADDARAVAAAARHTLVELEGGEPR
jgi:hypothetical protein